MTYFHKFKTRFMFHLAIAELHALLCCNALYNNWTWLFKIHVRPTYWREKSTWVNCLAHGRFQFNITEAIFKLTSVNDGWGISYKIALRRMPQDLVDGKSTLVQVVALCSQATIHYLSQCWPRSMSPNGVTRPQWVNNIHVLVAELDWSWRIEKHPTSPASGRPKPLVALHLTQWNWSQLKWE